MFVSELDICLKVYYIIRAMVWFTFFDSVLKT